MIMLAKILLWWGSSILFLLYMAAAVSIAADAYFKHGAGALVLAIVLLSAIPSMIAGVVLSELSDRKKVKIWSVP
jgi:hypothetical protein